MLARSSPRGRDERLFGIHDVVRRDTVPADAREDPGNGHMLMMDRNSDQVAQMVQKWMADKGLMK